MITKFEELTYTCCFCNNGIVSNEVDPLNINIIAKYDRPDKEKPSQDFYAHFECFKSKLHDNVSGYFIETNFM